MLVNISKSLKQKGQGIVEYALLLAFVVGIAMMLNGANIKGEVNEVFDDVVSLLSGGNQYAAALKKYGSMTRRDLVKLGVKNGKYYIEEDIVSNEDRLAADREALENIADLFLNMSYSDLTKLMKGVSADYFLNPEKDNNTKKGVLILNYTDQSGVEKNYNSETGQYAGTYDEGSGTYTDNAYSYGSDTYITFGTNNQDVRQGFTSEEVIHWMQGDYGNIKDPNGQYNPDLNFNSGTRYFYSNEMINPNSDKNRNVRVRFTVTGTDDRATGGTDNRKVTGVQVRLQNDGKNIENAVVTKGNFVPYGT